MFIIIIDNINICKQYPIINMFLLFLFMVSTLAIPDYVSFGLASNFDIIPDTFSECNNTRDCYNDICSILANNSLATLVSVSDDQSLNKIHISVNMIVFGIFENRTIINNSSLTCYSFIKCVNRGLKIKGLMWMVFAGQCY